MNIITIITDLTVDSYYYRYNNDYYNVIVTRVNNNNNNTTTLTIPYQLGVLTVYIVAQNGGSAYSGELQVNLPPAPPAIPIFKNINTIGSDNVITIEADPNATGYYYHYEGISELAPVSTVVTVEGNTTLTIPYLNKVLYIVAKNGKSAYSEELQVNLPPEIPIFKNIKNNGVDNVITIETDPIVTRYYYHYEGRSGLTLVSTVVINTNNKTRLTIPSMLEVVTVYIVAQNQYSGNGNLANSEKLQVNLPPSTPKLISITSSGDGTEQSRNIITIFPDSTVTRYYYIYNDERYCNEITSIVTDNNKTTLTIPTKSRIVYIYALIKYYVKGNQYAYSRKLQVNLPPERPKVIRVTSYNGGYRSIIIATDPTVTRYYYCYNNPRTIIDFSMVDLTSNVDDNTVLTIPYSSQIVYIIAQSEYSGEGNQYAYSENLEVELSITTPVPELLYCIRKNNEVTITIKFDSNDTEYYYSYNYRSYIKIVSGYNNDGNVILIFNNPTSDFIYIKSYKLGNSSELLEVTLPQDLSVSVTSTISSITLNNNNPLSGVDYQYSDNEIIGYKPFITTSYTISTLSDNTPYTIWVKATYSLTKYSLIMLHTYTLPLPPTLVTYNDLNGINVTVVNYNPGLIYYYSVNNGIENKITKSNLIINYISNIINYKLEVIAENPVNPLKRNSKVVEIVKKTFPNYGDSFDSWSVISSLLWTLPGIPNLTISEVLYNKIAVKINNFQNESRYFYSINGGQYKTCLISNKEFDITDGLIGNTNYIISVKATNPAGNTLYDEISQISQRTLSTFTSLPSTPLITISDVSTNSIKVNVSNIETDVSYSYSTNSQNYDNVLIADLPNINITGLTSNTNYNIKIKATNSIVDTLYSISEISQYTLPSAPIITINNSDITTNSIKVYVSNIEDVSYSYSIGSVYTYCLIIDSYINITGLSGNTNYNIKIKATNLTKDTLYKISDSITKLTLPTAPNINIASITSSSIKGVIDNPQPNVNCIYVYNGVINNFTLDSSETTDPLFNITGLENDNSYSIIVNSTNDTGTTTTTLDFTTLPLYPIITTSSIAPTTIRLNIQRESEPQDEKSYKYSINNIDFFNIAPPNEVDITGLTSNTNYNIKIQSTDLQGNVKLINIYQYTKPPIPLLRIKYSNYDYETGLYYYIEEIIPNLIYKYYINSGILSIYYNIDTKVNKIYIEENNNIIIYSTNLGGTSRYATSTSSPPLR
jgi:hypothetical protein